MLITGYQLSSRRASSITRLTDLLCTPLLSFIICSRAASALSYNSCSVFLPRISRLKSSEDGVFIREFVVTVVNWLPPRIILGRS